ncbi:MAG: hypothetical protein WCG31_06595 [Deltaproteobacteria bacterium]
MIIKNSNWSVHGGSREADSIQLADLTIENRLDRVSINGSIDLISQLYLQGLNHLYAAR